jgi:hypothetical protein
MEFYRNWLILGNYDFSAALAASFNDQIQPTSFVGS